MARLLIIWHSRTGGSEAIAKAAEHAAAAETDTLLIRAEDASPDDLLAAGGYIFAAPENLASLSGEMKAFFDRCYYPLLGQIEGRPFAAMVCAGSDGEGAARQIARIATGWRLKPIADPLIVVTGAQSPEAIAAPKVITEAELSRCRELGALMGAGLAMGVF